MKLRKIFSVLGPGFVTGASDDDPAGIATYSQTGAMFGYSLAWTELYSWPLMISVQYVSGRIGAATGKGLAANLKSSYPAWILYVLTPLLFIANTINVGADIGAMGAAAKLIVPLPGLLFVIVFGVATVLLISFLGYDSYSKYLKWLTLSLLAYLASAILAGTDWAKAGAGVFIPSFSFDSKSLGMIVAVLGTTISPYLVFWESSHEVESRKAKDGKDAALKDKPRKGKKEMKRLRTDTLVGMAMSNIVGLFIIVTCAATLHQQGHSDIKSAAEAAAALKPVAGQFATWIFAAGIVGTGLLAVPVLAGSAAFALGEGFGWRVGLDFNPKRAKAFYGIIAFSVAIGIVLNLIEVNIISFLVATAIINGVVEIPIIAMMLLVGQNRKLMGKFVIPRFWSILGWVTVGVITLSAVAALVTL
jgi:NRAMP (natural resistance-associated macrophage protein)-like metal ion transporter